MKYTNSEQWYQEYGKEVMDKDELVFHQDNNGNIIVLW